MHITRGTRVVAAALAAGMLLAGCGANDDGGSESGVENLEDGGDAGGGADFAGGQEAPQEAQTDSAEAGDDGSDGGEGTDAPDARANRDIIYRAAMTLSSDDPDMTVDGVERAATAAGGFVSNTQLQRGNDDLLRGSMTIRVPAENLESLLDAVSETAAQVTQRDQDAEDVTGQVADIESRLRNLRALEEELLVLLTEAREGGDTEDVLSVFDRVGQVREEIEVLEGRQQDLGDQVALSTLTVQVEPSPSLLASRQSEPDQDLPLPWSPGNVATSAMDATVAALQSFVDVVIRAALFLLPVLLVWLSPLWIALLVAMWWRRRRGDRRSGGTDTTTDHDRGPGGPGTPGVSSEATPPAAPSLGPDRAAASPGPAARRRRRRSDDEAAPTDDAAPTDGASSAEGDDPSGDRVGSRAGATTAD